MCARQGRKCVCRRICVRVCTRIWEYVSRVDPVVLRHYCCHLCYFGLIATFVPLILTRVCVHADNELGPEGEKALAPLNLGSVLET